MWDQACALRPHAVGRSDGVWTTARATDLAEEEEEVEEGVPELRVRPPARSGLGNRGSYDVAMVV